MRDPEGPSKQFACKQSGVGLGWTALSTTVNRPSKETMHLFPFSDNMLWLWRPAGALNWQQVVSHRQLRPSVLRLLQLSL